jgi:hypothetical protein
MRAFAHQQKLAQEAKAAFSARPGRSSSEHSREVGGILHLQRTIGHQAVQRAEPDVPKAHDTIHDTTHPAYDFSRIPLFMPAPLHIQPKLAVSAPGDSYEQEADSVAEHVMKMAQPTLRHDCACGSRCSKCNANQTEQEGKRLQTKRLPSGDAEKTEAPPIVHEVLNSAGQPLDPETRAFMEPRFGHDFSHVRVHSGAAAEQSARGLKAHAYTVGHSVVFGAGRFAPGTHEGRRLLAHELTHVTQQLNGVIARQPAPPDPGWSGEKGLNKSVTMVDEKGNIQPGKDAEKAGNKGVWRVPVEGLSKGLQTSIRKSATKSRAVALIPNTVSPPAPDKDNNVQVDVLFHLHGFGAGYRELDPKETDYAGVLMPGQLRDVELYQMEQQLLSHVKTSQRLIIAVLPQGSDRSDFGNLSANSDAYLKEVFDNLVPRYLPKGATPGRVIVSGHSGGGPTTMAIANQRAKAGKRTDVLLFDSINFGCKEKVQATDKEGKLMVNKKGDPVMVCKKGSECTSNEYFTASKWVTDHINADIKSLDGKSDANQKTELQTNGTRFRGYTSESLKTTNTCSYGFWYSKLKTDIEQAIMKPKLSEDVRNQLRQNYQVSEMKGPHERLIGQGNLETALKD